MISVTKNSHMPNVDASFCWSMSAKWCCSECSAISISLVANGDLLVRLMLIVVGFPGHDRSLVKIVRGRRRRRPPLQAYRVPRIRSRQLAILKRPHEIDHGQDVAHGQH